MKLLIVDDEPHIRQMMRLTLEASGYQVDEAASGDEGLTRFGDGTAYDAVVLDQKMPALDGLETLQRMKERAPDASVLMSTAFASIEVAVDAHETGCDRLPPEADDSGVASKRRGRRDRSPRLVAAARRATLSGSP